MMQAAGLAPRAELPGAGQENEQPQI
jgi:hypothetical protein